VIFVVVETKKSFYTKTMFTDTTSIVLFLMTSLLFTSLALLRARALRAARAKASRSAKHLLRDSAH
jgi:hypothetical protein